MLGLVLAPLDVPLVSSFNCSQHLPSALSPNILLGEENSQDSGRVTLDGHHVPHRSRPRQEAMRNKGEMEEKESGASEAEIASESHDGGSSESGDDAVGEAVSHALEALVALDSEDLEYAMHEVLLSAFCSFV